MKKLYKATAENEGKKVQVSLGNIKEVYKVAAKLLVDKNQPELLKEFGVYLGKTASKMYNCPVGVMIAINQIGPEFEKKTANKKVAKKQTIKK